jgi:aryl-alcohol dehydrogenase-like predicted oxidoreductase
MKKVKLKGIDLEVPRLCFGTMTFGKPVDQASASRMIAYCLDRGINFVDTANVYQAGLAESMLGEVMRGKRDQSHRGHEGSRKNGKRTGSERAFKTRHIPRD